MNRLRYVVRRLILSFFVVLGVVTLTFIVARVIPADPARMMAGARARAEQIEKVRVEYGLDRPLHVQYIRYVSGLLRLEFGTSFRSRQPIADELRQFLPATLELVFLSILLALIIGVPVGVVAAARRKTVLDNLLRVVSISGVSIPPFFLALLLQILFFKTLGWLPLAGRVDQDTLLYHPIQAITGFYLFDTLVTGNWLGFKSAVVHAILPAITLAMYPIGVVALVTRAAMTEVLSENFIRAAHAAGLSEPTILFQLALKNAIVPALTIVGLSAAYSIAGAFLIEAIFVWPGVGRFVFEAIASLDFPVILAVTLVVTVCYIVINLLIDLIQVILDPRVTLD